MQQDEETEDLIRLDSTSSDLDDFDPLKSKSSNDQLPLSISNPLYTYEEHKLPQNNSSLNRNDQDLLKEYGLNFNFTNLQNQQHFDPFPTTTVTNKVNSQSQWTKFE